LRRLRPVGARDRWIAAAAGAGALLVWEVLARLDVIPAIFFPPPSRIARTLVASIASGELPHHLGATAARVLPGLLIGGVPGLIAGIAMGWSRRLRAVADPIVAALHPIPKLALLPLFMVLFGIGEAPRVMVIAVSAFFPVLINAMAGVRQIQPAHIEAALCYGGGRMNVLRHVILPGSLPLVLAGVRQAANLALLVAIAVEMMAPDAGLGALVWISWQVLRVERLYATLLVIALLGAALNAALEWIARRSASWLPDHEGMI
jgi:NitT/TauT family transport system permease protein